ncbi:guanine nucleotide exchange factor for Rab-3A-like [Branchiostoma floridae x Branchiostoma belcheri]
MSTEESAKNGDAASGMHRSGSDNVLVKPTVHFQVENCEETENQPENGSVESPEHEEESVENGDHAFSDHEEGSPVRPEGQGLAAEAPRIRSPSVAEVKGKAYERLQEELSRAQQELLLKDEECEKLSRVRDQIGQELEELTASLFEEAHNMVREANVARASAEKRLKEANSKIDMLQAEVEALKTLVITSTPSMPNHQHHPQLQAPAKSGITAAHFQTHKRSTSFEPQTAKQKQAAAATASTPQDSKDQEEVELDPILHQEFMTWRKSPSLTRDVPFLARIYSEDILPCLEFKNAELAAAVQEAVENNTLCIEPINGVSSFPRLCALSQVTKVCKYRLKLENDDKTYNISQATRNRIAAVCDFMTYIRYIQLGLVKSVELPMYLEIVRLRKRMALAKLGCLQTTG